MAWLTQLLALLALSATADGCSGPRTPRNFHALVANASVYDRTGRPPCGNSTHQGPTIIEVQLRLMHLNSVDPKAGTIVVNAHLRTWWHDPRLAYPGKADGGCVDAIDLFGDDMQSVWMPDIYFDNLVEQTATGMASHALVHPDGSVRKSQQVLLTVKSKFDLTKLPYEENTAQIVVASYSQDITQIRVMAKGGTVGEGISGIGIDAAPLTSSVWVFPEGAAEDGFTTPGYVEVLGGWDYLTMSWNYSRNPKYFLTQVIAPCVLFLLICYIQFWVAADAVPARAALATIPVLIMRTMSNSIYSSIPQGSQFMWLDVFVEISMVLCVAAALHFGVVQALRIVEAKQAAKLAGLVKSKPVAEKLMAIARKGNVTLVSLLRRFAPVQRTLTHQELLDMTATASEEVVGAVSGESSPREVEIAVADDVPMTVRSEEAKKAGVTEADLLFIMYAREVFRRHDRDDSNHVCPVEVRACFTFFNVYMSTSQVVKVVAMFLRDSGNPSQLDERKNVLTFSQFTALLMKVDQYSLKLGNDSSTRAFFESIPPSERWDVAARWVFPVLLALQFMVMYTLLAVL